MDRREEEEGGGDVVGTMLQLLRQPPPNTRLQLSTGHEYNAVSLLISNTTRPGKGKTKIQIFCKYCTKTLLILATKAMTKSNILPGTPILRGAIFPIEDSIYTLNIVTIVVNLLQWRTMAKFDFHLPNTLQHHCWDPIVVYYTSCRNVACGRSLGVPAIIR